MPAIRENVLNHTFRYLKFFNNTLIPIEVGADDDPQSDTGDAITTTQAPLLQTPATTELSTAATTTTLTATTETTMASTHNMTESSFLSTLAQKTVSAITEVLNTTVSSISELVYTRRPSSTSATPTQTTDLPLSSTAQSFSSPSTTEINTTIYKDAPNTTLSTTETMQNLTTSFVNLTNQTDGIQNEATVSDHVTDAGNITNSVFENITNATYQTLEHVANTTSAGIKDVVSSTLSPFISETTTNSDQATSELSSTNGLSTSEISSTATTPTSPLKEFVNTTISSFVNATNSSISTVERVVSTTTTKTPMIAKPAIYDVISKVDDHDILTNQNFTFPNDNWTITEVGSHPEINRGDADVYNSDPSQLLYVFAVLGAYVIIICILVMIQMRRRNRYETLDDEYYDEYLMRKQMLTERRTLLKMNIKRIRGVKDGYLLDKILPNQEV